MAIQKVMCFGGVSFTMVVLLSADRLYRVVRADGRRRRILFEDIPLSSIGFSTEKATAGLFHIEKDKSADLGGIGPNSHNQ
jgi:hypothetical protein